MRLIALLAGCAAVQQRGANDTATAPASQADVESHAVVEPTTSAEPAAQEAEQSQTTVLRLPFEGIWVVGQGYHGAETHAGRAAYALDFVKLGPNWRAYRRHGKWRRDWHSFGARVLCAADGVVVKATDDRRDNAVGGQATEPNSVIVQHAEREYSEFVHLKRGSVRVSVGDQVRSGQVIALAGNSGAETPHLHWAFLSSVKPIRTQPAVFADYELRDEAGAWTQTTGTPASGDVVRGPKAAPRERR